MGCAEFESGTEHGNHLCGYCANQNGHCKNCNINIMFEPKNAKCNFLRK